MKIVVDKRCYLTYITYREKKMRPTIPRARKANDSSCRGCSQNYQDECRIFQIPRTRREAKFRGKSDPNCVRGN